MEASQGYRTWFVPDGYLPTTLPSAASPTGYVSHESLCVLNCSQSEAECTLDLFFEDRAPIKGIQFTVGAERTLHFRLDRAKDLEGRLLPRDVPYALRLTSSERVIVQHTRVDVTQPNLALFSVMAWAHPKD
ncbi:MAG: hypothetical protein FJW26_05955 [Acidimicrobiia bacterium]|nr:hypothetical protein [Acidimicrobiia bacterium]